MSGAIAIFAKTKTLSPVKTRLAKDIGYSLTEEFYSLCLEAVSEIMHVVQTKSGYDIVPYWALAEQEAIDYQEWQAFDSIWTGEGSLGKRLHHIYSSLREKHEYVMMIGTDSPQLSPHLIINALKKFHAHPESYVVGPAFDGGFYLFIAQKPIPEHIWTNVPYSDKATLKELRFHLTQYGFVEQLLSFETDIDTIYDLKLLQKSLQETPDLLPAQQKLYHWLQYLSSSLMVTLPRSGTDCLDNYEA